MEFEQFAASIGVMKPSHIDEDNQKHVQKLKLLLLSPEYVAEDKIDGCHYLMIGSRFLSTDKVEKTHNFPHLFDFFNNLKMYNLILDGEINYPGKTSQYVTRVTGSEASKAIAFQNENTPIHYTMWDILRTPKGTWLIDQPLVKRRQVLEQFYNCYVKGTAMEKYIHLTEFRLADKELFFKDIIAAGGEGCVLKSLNSLYIMNKKPQWQWVKMKQEDTADFFISGYDAPETLYQGKNIEDWNYWEEVNGEMSPVTRFYYKRWIGALQLSAYVDGVPTQVCTCSGMDEVTREKISANRNACLNKVVKVTYMEKTEAGRPRHPRFTAFHESKTAKECTWVLRQEE